MNIEETETLAFTYDRHFFSPQRLASCPWTKQSHLGKCSNGKLCNWTLVNDGTLRSTANFASALSNVNNVKILDLVEFFSFSSYPKIICRKLQDYENVHEGDFFFLKLKKISGRSSFRFSPAILQKHTWMATFLWSYL